MSNGPPKRIWLQWHGDEDDPDFDAPHLLPDVVTWCQDQVFTSDIEYVLAGKTTRRATAQRVDNFTTQRARCI